MIAASETAWAEMHAAFARMRERSALRNHFHAGAMAAMAAVSASGTAEEQAAAIMRAQDDYVDLICPSRQINRQTEESADAVEA